MDSPSIRIIPSLNVEKSTFPIRTESLTEEETENDNRNDIRSEDREPAGDPEQVDNFKESRCRTCGGWIRDGNASSNDTLTR